MTGTKSGAARRRPVEVELKYRLATIAAGERYLVLDELAGFRPVSPVRTTQLEDRYLDTKDGLLARAGFAARLRGSATGTIVTVKSTARVGPAAVAHRRDELEGAADRTAGPADWPASDARSLILELCGDAPLVELTTVRQLRRMRELRDGGTVVELSVDEVDVVARSRIVERFAELEIELVKGAESRLTSLDEALAADPALVPASGSKLETALAAVRREKFARGVLPNARDLDETVDVDLGVGPDETAGGAPDAAPVIAAEAEVGGSAGTASADSRAAEAAGPGRAAADADGPGGRAGEAERGPRRNGHDEPSSDLAGEVPSPATQASAAAALPAPEQPSARRKPRLATAKTPGVSADDSTAEAGRKVLRFHFARMLAREAGTRDGSDPEELHAMRVATRRMRAAWRVFGDGFRPGRTKRYRGRLREIAGRLGAVRDLDVLLEAADAYRLMVAPAERRALQPLLTAWRTYREDARVLLLHELDSDSYTRFVEDFRVFVQTEGADVVPVVAMQPHRIRDTAPARLWDAYGRVRAYEPVLRWADVETLHDLRIAGKWLRYTLEFVREPLGDGVAPLIARVTALQDHLGLLNDGTVAASMARSFLLERAGTLGPAESAAIGRFVVSRERDVARLRRSIGVPWRGAAGVGFRRTLGRVVAGL